jgi:hypothetical protein
MFHPPLCRIIRRDENQNDSTKVQIFFETAIFFIDFYYKIGSNAFTQVSQVSPTRPERAEAPSPGHRPGCLWTQTCRPVRAKAFKYLAIYKAFALTGRLADCYYTQGAALG